MPKMRKSAQTIKIYNLLKTSNPPLTYQEIADKYGISRQRVGQIWNSFEDKKYQRNAVWRKNQKAKIKAEKDEKVKYHCEACKKPVKRKHARKSLCRGCHRILNEENKDPHTALVCKECGKKYHPIRNWRNLESFRGKYCSQKCYIDSGTFPNGYGKGGIKNSRVSRRNRKIRLEHKFRTRVLNNKVKKSVSKLANRYDLAKSRVQQIIYDKSKY